MSLVGRRADRFPIRERSGHEGDWRNPVGRQFHAGNVLPRGRQTARSAGSASTWSPASCRTRFQRSARDLGHQLVEWECDWSAAERLGAGAIVPDARVVYATPEYEIEAFVEVDIGTERTRFFAEKLRRYIELFRSGTWRAHLASWPLVLTVVPDERRGLALGRLAAAVRAKAHDAGDVEFWFGESGRVVAGPLGPVWEVNGRARGQRLLPD